jgi:hypothetical protein
MMHFLARAYENQEKKEDLAAKYSEYYCEI